MKIIHIKNLKRECVLVELPNGCDNPRVWPDDPRTLYYDDPNGYDGINSTELPIPCKLLGHFPSLTKQDFEGVVLQEYHRNYKESFLSLLMSMGYWTKGNPYGSENSAIKNHEYNDWQKAQEKVIDLSRCYLFIKE